MLARQSRTTKTYTAQARDARRDDKARITTQFGPSSAERDETVSRWMVRGNDVQEVAGALLWNVA